MKTQIIFENNIRYGYRRKDIINKEKGVRIVSYLLNEINGDPTFYLKNLKDRTSPGLSDDSMQIDKEGDISYIYFNSEDIFAKRDPRSIPINTQHLIDLIEKWASLYETGYDEIILEQHGDKFTLTGKWLPEEVKNPPIIEIVFSEDEKGEYIPDHYPNHPFGQLVYFFRCELQNDDKPWIDFLNNARKKYKKGDTVNIEKKANLVYVSEYPKSWYVNKPQWAFPIKKENLVSIIKTWDALIKQKPKEIILKKQNDEVIVKEHS